MSRMRKRTETAKLSTAPEQLWPHLRHVTLSDIRQELPSSLFAWAFASVCSVGFGWLIEKMLPGESATWASPLPHWANYAIICAVALWFLRGLRIPRWTLGGWLFASLYAGGLSFIAFNCPIWISFPVFWGAWLLVSMLDTLNETGRAKAESIDAGRAGDESAVSAP